MRNNMENITRKEYEKAKNIVKKYEEEQFKLLRNKKIVSSIPTEQWKVHESHCSKNCCKYVDADCP